VSNKVPSSYSGARRSAQPVERMKRFRIALIASVLFGYAGWAATPAAAPDASQEREIVAVALENFAKWDKATFGEQTGVLEVASSTRAQPELNSGRVMYLARNIRTQVTEELAVAFVQRNRAAAPVAELTSGSQWVKVRDTKDSFGDLRDLPAGVKAVGYLTLPGIAPGGDAALVQLNHSWSIHGAIVTYILAKTDAGWKVVARDQMVFP
jgi:hypothetical protein